MNYELIKNIDDITYENFRSLRSQIGCGDKNINTTFRSTAEGLFMLINKRHDVIKPNNSFYNTALNCREFQFLLINNYRCDSKIMNCLNNIRVDGNPVVHNVLKVFDKNDVFEKFKRLIYFTQHILKTDYSIDLNMTNEKIQNEFDLLINKNNIDFSQESVDKNIKQEMIEVEEKKLKNKFDSIANKFDFCNQENIESVKDIYSICINHVIEENKNFNSIEDLKFSSYKLLYENYYRIENLLLINDDKDCYLSFCDVIDDIKRFIKNAFNQELFSWLYDDQSEVFEDYTDYSKIANVIDEIFENPTNQIEDTIYYIDKQKPFFVNDNKYYQLEIRKAIDYGNKNNKKIVYSKEKIRDDYAERLSLARGSIELLGVKSDIFVVTSSFVAIRPCEIKNLIRLISTQEVTVTKSNLYNKLMNHLELNNINLLDVVLSSEKNFENFLVIFDDITSKECICFIETMKTARDMILNENEGSNVVRYILGTMNNYVIKKQINKDYCIPNTYIYKRSLQFDRKPYSYSLCNHNPRYFDIARCIPAKYYENDILGRKIRNYINDNQTLFAPVEELNIDNIHNFISLYNLNVYNNDKEVNDSFKLTEDGKYIYINRDLSNLRNIIDYVRDYTFNCDNNYGSLLDAKYDSLGIDSDEKREIIKSAFDKSKMLFVYGKAGTGKTELICNYFAKIFSKYNILFLAKTHAALNNMKKRIIERFVNKPDNFEFLTIDKVKYSNELYNKYQVLIIDECKMIMNDDILKIFEHFSFNYCILSGDIAQLDAIGLGNWFDVCKHFSNNSSRELEKVCRSSNETLINIWDKVRNQDESVYKDLEKNNIIENISPSFYEPIDNDEIILCLNYGGRYGINEINSHFQNTEEKEHLRSYTYKLEKYKEEDPIVFNNDATALYDGVVYNNLKGKILSIDDDDEWIHFELKIYEYINLESKSIKNLTILYSNKTENWTKAKLKIKKYRDNSNDESDYLYTVPFEIAYARSIHKAQGLEYNSVKIIITPESEENIDNFVFYTAVTRAKKYLKIYIASTSKLDELNLLNKRTGHDADILQEYKLYE